MYFKLQLQVDMAPELRYTRQIVKRQKLHHHDPSA
jgi:hypothetical protein